MVAAVASIIDLEIDELVAVLEPVIMVHVNTFSNLHVDEIFSARTNIMRWPPWNTQGLARVHRVIASVVDTRLGTCYNEFDEQRTKTTDMRSICAIYTKYCARFQCYVKHTAHIT